MINYYGLVELINLWEDDEGRAIVDNIMNNMFPGTKKYHIFGHCRTFTDFSEVWSIHYLLAMVRQGMIKVPKERMVHRIYVNSDNLVLEDDFILIPKCGEIYIPGDAGIIEND